MKRKKRKGLCFKCDEKYCVGHECLKKELRVMLVINEGKIEVGEDGKILRKIKKCWKIQRS